MARSPTSSPRRRQALIAIVVLSVAGILGTVALWPHSPSPATILSQAQAELKHGRFAAAEVLANKVPSDSVERDAAILVAGESATKLGRLDDALRYYSQASKNGSTESVLALFSAGEVLLHLGRLSAAEEQYRLVLRHNPAHPLAHARLAYVLGASGRRWESAPHLLELIRLRQFDASHLLLLGDLERTLNEVDMFAMAHRGAPDDPSLHLGQARVALHENRLPDAVALLRKVIAKRPLEIEAQCRLGATLFEMGDEAAWSHWHERLLPEADNHPDIWIVRSAWAQRQNDREGAARCLWQAVRLDPNHRQACYRLGQILLSLDAPGEADLFVSRAQGLQSLSIVLDGLFQNRGNVAAMERAARLCETLGRLPESWGWAQFAISQDGRLTWARETMARLETKLSGQWQRCLPEHNPALQVDLSHYSFPRWNSTATTEEAPLTTSLPPRTFGHIEFADRATESGLSFRYFNGRDKATPGAKIFETTGGGVAVLDLDGDRWPDIYFTQGCRWPTPDRQSEHLDRVFRNLGTGRFADVTESARLGDERFSQGAAIGDFNNDGFADLYLANLGANRLYRNEGDGTFTDVSESAGVGGESWTTSVAMADLNGDGWPDLFDANYCDPRENLEIICEKQGLPQSCSPRTFPPAEDRLLLNRADGRFEDVTAEAGIKAPNGYGLGVVAADFDGSGRLSLFVANDETPNFYFANQTRQAGGPLRFVERGVLSGLANDENGIAQACMGIAAADVNGDGRLDLFVTNFFHESNTLYLQQAEGGFLDETRQANLRDGSFDMLGFGAQFLDADLDGWPDLVLTNGHIDDLSRLGRPYKMPPQCYRNTGAGRFVELPAKSLGEFFAGRLLGRGLARLDWNRDGLPDFVVSHIDAPAALVTNQTRAAGNFLAIELRGVESARDAIGAVVGLKHKDLHWTGQLTAGDGYQASNQRHLLFGLGDLDSVDEIYIRWPSGREDRHAKPPVNRELLVIEGLDLHSFPTVGSEEH